MPEYIQIEQMRLSDKDRVLAFLHRAYGENPRMSDARVWDWHFLENPYVSPDDLPVWIAKSGSSVVGQLAATPVELKVGETREKAIWILDLIVDPLFRRRGIAKRLVLLAEEFCPVGLGVNTTKQRSTEVLESIGWKVVRGIPRYAKLLFPGSAVREISSVAPLRKTVNRLYGPFRPRPDASVFGSGGKLRIVENFDAAFDDLWREASGQFACAVAREPRFLEWQFIKQPGKTFDIIGYFEAERLLGYAVVYVRKADDNGVIAKASIADLCYHGGAPGKIVDELIRGALEIAVARRAGSLVTDATDPFIGTRLLRVGFRQVKSNLQFLVKSSRKQELLLNADNWFLTRGDSDVSIFEQPNL